MNSAPGTDPDEAKSAIRVALAGTTISPGIFESIVVLGRDEAQPARQRYECQSCHRRFDDLTATIFAGTWRGVVLSRIRRFSREASSSESERPSFSLTKSTTRTSPCQS